MVDLSKFLENYMHRIGRCGRYGRKCVAINIINNREQRDMNELEKFFSLKVDPMIADIKNILDY